MPAKDLAFAQRLKELLVGEQLKQADAAHKCGITVTSLQNYLSGRLPQPAQAKAIAAAFNVPLSWLIDGGEKPQTLVSEIPLQIPSIKPSAFAAMSRTPEDLAEDVEATADQVRAWMAGRAQPSHRQLVLLFNELAKAATALARCDHGAQRPESVPPQPAQAVA